MASTIHSIDTTLVEVKDFAVKMGELAVAGNKVTYIIAKNETIIADLTISPLIELQFVNTGKITVPTGVTLTIGKMLHAPLRQIFAIEGTGLVVFNSGSVEHLIPEWFGAVGDGVTDDTTYLQNVCDCAMSSDVRTIELQQQYAIVSTIAIDGTNPINVTGQNNNTEILTTDSDIICLKVETAGCSFSNFKITMPGSATARGSNSDPDYPYPVGLLILDADNCIVDGLTVTGSHDEGILVKDSSGVNIKNCIVSDCYYMSIMANDSDKCRIENCTVYGPNTQCGIRTERGHNTIIKNNIIYDAENEGNGIRIEDSRGCIIDGNNINDCGGSGIIIYGPGSGYAVGTDYNVVRGNFIKNCASPGAGYYAHGGGGIELRATAQSNIIEGNICLNDKQITWISDCDDSSDWTAGSDVVIGNETASSVRYNGYVSRVTQGLKSLTINPQGGFTGGRLCYINLASAEDFSSYTHISLTISHGIDSYTGIDEIRLYSSDDCGGSLLDTMPIIAVTKNSSFVCCTPFVANPATLTAVKCIELYRTTSSTAGIMIDQVVAGVGQPWGIAIHVLGSGIPRWNLIKNNQLIGNYIGAWHDARLQATSPTVYQDTENIIDGNITDDHNFHWEQTPHVARKRIFYTDFDVAATMSTLTLCDLPVGGMLRRVKIRYTGPWGGGSCSNLRLSVGNASDADKYSSGTYDLDQLWGDGDTHYTLAEGSWIESNVVTTPIIATVETSTGTLDQLTTGDCDIWLQIVPFSFGMDSEY